MEDREGSLWVGLLDAGAVQLRDGKFSVFGTPEGLSGNYTGNVMQARGRHDVDQAPTTRGSIICWRMGAWRSGTRAEGLPNQAVYSILQRRDGSLWVGFQRGTIAEIRNGHVLIWRDPQASDASVNALYEDREGRLWVGFFGHGSGPVRARSVPPRHRRPDAFPALPNPGRSLVDRPGRGWRGAAAGTAASPGYTTANGLHSDHVMSLYADPDGSLWAGTSGGGVSHIHDGRRGHLDAGPEHAGHIDWLDSSRTTAAISGSAATREFSGLRSRQFAETAGKPAEKLQPVLYGTADGLRSRETLYGSMPCAWKSRDGRLWFGTIDGVAVIDPSHIPINTIVPPVWIERMTFDGHSIPLQNGIRLKHGSGNLEVSFTAPSFVAPQRVRFRYRLVGFDPDWIYSGTRRNAWYTNLPPGNYTFIVQAENNDAVRNLTGASFGFVLRASPTQTPLAYLCYVLAGLLLTWGIIAFRTRSLTRRQERADTAGGRAYGPAGGGEGRAGRGAVCAAHPGDP